MATTNYTGDTSSKEPATVTTLPAPIVEAQKMGTVTPIKVPTPSPYDTSKYTSTINSVTGSVQAQADAVMREQEAQQKLAQAQGLSADVATLTSQMGGKTADTANLYQNTGVNTAFKQLQDINAQATGLRNEALAAPIANTEANRLAGRVTTTGVAQGQTEAALRQNALKALSLGQQAAIAQADFNTAKNLADQQIDMKYEQMSADLKAKQLQLASLEKYELTPAQERAKEALARQYKKEDEEMVAQQEAEKELEKMLINARAQGAPVELVEAARTAKTPTEAAMKLGQWSGNYWSIEKAKQDALKARAANVPTTATAVGTYVKGSDPQADAWASRIANKQAKLSDVPSAMRTRVAMAMGASPEQSAKATEIQSEMKTILERMKGYKGIATGPKAQMFPVASQVDLPIPFSGSNQTSDALADAERLSALLTTENIAIMKGLGSMSNIEFGNIEKIGSSILGRDKDGNAYFKGTRANYDREIQRLVDDLNKLPEMTQTSTPAPATLSKWTRGDVQNTPTPLSGMVQKNYINPKSPFGTIDFNLPTKP